MRFQQGVLVPSFYVARDFLLPLPDGLQVREDQFCGDDLNVPHRINVPGDVDDVRVLEAAHNVNERVHLADVAEELVAETLSMGGAFYQPCDVHELEGRGNLRADLGDLGNLGQSRLGHTHDAEVGLDRAKRVILRGCLVRAGDSVEECGLPDVREADNACL